MKQKCTDGRRNNKGNPNLAEIGKKTRFTAETSAKARKIRDELRPIKFSINEIAKQTLYGHPPMKDEQLKAVAEFFHVTTEEVTFAHVAFFKTAVAMAQGDGNSIDRVVLYAGEKPVENINITQTDYTELDSVAEDLKNHG